MENNLTPEETHARRIRIYNATKGMMDLLRGMVINDHLRHSKEVLAVAISVLKTILHNLNQMMPEETVNQWLESIEYEVNTTDLKGSIDETELLNKLWNSPSAEKGQNEQQDWIDEERKDKGETLP